MLSRIFGRLRETASASTVAHEELLRLYLEKGCTIVDVREPDEYARGHIPGAINQPLSRFDPARIPHAGRTVLICQAGGRSAAALKRMSAAGRQDVQHYPAGMAGWRAARGPVET
jgi:rhodanese-related sulfurtransferase